MHPMVSFQTDGLIGPSVSFTILLAALALSAFILWRRYQSRRRLIERVAEMEALSNAGRAIVVAQLDVSALSELIAREAGKIIDNRTFQIGLFEDNRYHIIYWTIDNKQKQTDQPFDLSDRRGLVGWVRDNKRSILVRDFAKEMSSLPARPRYVSSSPPRSGVFVPLISGDKVLGIVAAQSAHANAFSEQDLGRLTILANQAAAAIANAQIYNQERQRAAHLELVSQIARQVSAINDLEDLLNQVVMLTRETFEFSSVNVLGIETNSGDAVMQASSIAGMEPGDLRIAPGDGLIGMAVASRSTTLSNDTLDDSRFIGDSISTQTRSEIVIPLLVDQELLGVLDVQSNEPGAFLSQEQAVLEVLAAQVAVAIHKARQYAVQREQAWVTTAQLQVAEAIGQSGDLDSLTETMVRLTPLLVGIDQCAILLWDREQEFYRGTAIFGFSAEESRNFQDVNLKIGDWTPLDAVHVGMERLATRQQVPWGAVTGRNNNESNAVNNLLLPLRAQGRMLGVMVVGNEDGNIGNLIRAREELLRHIANQSAQAIDSIQLQLAQQEEAWVNTALLQVAEAVNKLTDLNEILYTIVRLVPMLVGVKTSVILVLDEERKTYRAGPSYGLSEMGYGLLDSFEVDLTEFPLLETQDVERVGPDAAYYTFKLPPWMITILGSKTADIFPLFARGRPVGALLVGPSNSDRPFSGRRLNIVTGIAQQAAIAVVNDQLYKESAERTRMEQELDVARSIQASLIPDGAPQIEGASVASYWQAARQVSGDFYDFMPLSDNIWGIAIADVADKGVPAALFMALSRTILRTVAFNRRNPSEVLQRCNRLIYGDTTSDLFVTIFYSIWNPAAETLTFASAGHNPPVLVHNDGTTSTLNTDGIALGVLENVQIKQKSIQLLPGDVVVFYTDGVTEAMNEDYDEFGMNRLRLVSSSARKGKAADIVNAITSAVAEHAGGTPQFDDITLVVMKHEVE
jgi:serine phosphatase RsbU (regulator of sigma subunit)/putative methionine-R-sulfoxide reductase with GAF domain